MKAIALAAFGSAAGFVAVELAPPAVSPGSVRVRVAAAAFIPS